MLLGTDRKWLLPAMGSNGAHLAFQALAHALKALQRSGALKLPDGEVRGHDLRRTWASTAAKLTTRDAHGRTVRAIDGTTIERQLQHALRQETTGLSAVAGVYLASDPFELRQAAVELVDAHWRPHWRASSTSGVVGTRR
jgi:integrase